MKKNKFKKISILSILFMVVALVCCIKAINTPKQLNSRASLTPEEKRAMTYSVVSDDDSSIDGTDNVKFNAYFLRDLDNDGYAEKYNGTCNSLSNKGMLYMDINVLTEGKLINGCIKINGQNFNYGMSMIADDVLKYDYISDYINKIELKDVNAGTQKLIYGKISPSIAGPKSYTKTNTVTFSGTYVPLDGEPVELNKTINLDVDWYGVTSAYMVENHKYDVTYDELEDDTIQFEFEIRETANQLILKENANKIKIPELCGYAPIEVKCVNSGVVSNYDSQLRELTITRTSVENEYGNVSKQISKINKYEVTVKYPEEAYRAIVSYETLKFNVEGYYTGYNNQNEEFQNPYKSNVVKDTIEFLIRKQPKADIYYFYVDYVDKRYLSSPYNKYVISNQDILNSYVNGDVSENKKFVVCWQAVRGSQGVVPSLIMKETKNEQNYGDKWDSTLIEDYIENTGIYFTGADEMLGEDGIISIYNNDTDELVKTFTNDEWNLYTSTNPYKYDSSIRHIRVETSNAKNNSMLNVYNVKELNTEKFINNFTADQVKEFNATHTYLTGICNIQGAESGRVDTSDIAYLIHDKSNVKLGIEKKTAIVYEKLENQKVYIDTHKKSSDEAKWKNGSFLVEVPKEIVSMEINNVTIDNANVEIEAYELYQDENEKYYIRICTKNDEPENYKITIDCNLVPNPRVATVNKAFKLFAYNELTNEYITDKDDIYDVNMNNKTQEKIGNAEAMMDILAPTSLITMETVTNYDENVDGEITIAPNVALVNNGEKNARINISLTNNYTNSVSDIRIIGKIPFKNNTYIINPKDLKSEFNTRMTSNGVMSSSDLPDSVKNNTIIYYSEKTSPTTDVNNSENGWKLKEDVDDWTKIVSYFIYIKDYKIAPGEKVEYSYDIELPENVNLNEAAYSTHAVYFCLNTDDGMIKLHTEPTKVGVKIVKLFNLELNKLKINSNVQFLEFHII